MRSCCICGDGSRSRQGMSSASIASPAPEARGSCPSGFNQRSSRSISAGWSSLGAKRSTKAMCAKSMIPGAWGLRRCRSRKPCHGSSIWLISDPSATAPLCGSSTAGTSSTNNRDRVSSRCRTLASDRAKATVCVAPGVVASEIDRHHCCKKCPTVACLDLPAVKASQWFESGTRSPLCIEQSTRGRSHKRHPGTFPISSRESAQHLRDQALAIVLRRIGNDIRPARQDATRCCGQPGRSRKAGRLIEDRLVQLCEKTHRPSMIRPERKAFRMLSISSERLGVYMMMRKSMRRFVARPAGVSLPATGRIFP